MTSSRCYRELTLEILGIERCIDRNVEIVEFDGVGTKPGNVIDALHHHIAILTGKPEDEMARYPHTRVPQESEGAVEIRHGVTSVDSPEREIAGGLQPELDPDIKLVGSVRGKERRNTRIYTVWTGGHDQLPEIVER